MKKVFISIIVIFLTITAFSQNTGIVVVTPNGGENWLIGCPNTISWITAAPGSVKIELYKSGSFCMTIASQVPATVNSYTWIPPYSLLAGSTYKVKITLLGSAAGLYDFSNDNFSLNTGTITVISPNGGEIWQYGTTHMILWSDNICENVRIELWKGGTFYSLLTASTPSTGSFPWAITNTIPPGNDYKIKIVSTGLNSGTTNVVYDFSDANFTIGGNGIIVIVPNGGEIWYNGGIYNITWIDNVAEYVRIELWKGGVFYTTISNSASNPYSWSIPASIVAGNDYKVKVIALSTNTAKFDFSDNDFTISSGCFVTVTSPNGGEVWAKGTTHIITWQDNTTYNVRIELWKGGVYNSLINASAPSTGSCYWAIPTTQQSGNDYKVKIIALSSNAASTCYDLSDNNFSIIGATVSKPVSVSGNDISFYPNPAGNTVHMKFSDNTILPVTIEVYKLTGERVLQSVAENTMDDGIIDVSTANVADGYYLLIIKKQNEMKFKAALVIRH